jgi:lauroyl/myristoyl acyltransferase
VEIIERKQKAAERPAFTADDTIFLMEWPLLKFASTAIPESRWSAVALDIERLKARLGLTAPLRRAPVIQQALALADLRTAESIAWQAAAQRTEHHIQVIKAASASGWEPIIHVDGEEHLQAALAQGKGAVLWVAHFCFNTQITKMALAARGYRVAHVSRPEHGFSKSRFGIRYLNPLRWKAEFKYLDQRIVIDRAEPGGSLRMAQAALLDNRVVSITAGAWEGHRIARGVLLGGRYPVATGAPDLARRSGAPLLPVISTRDPSRQNFRVEIGEPLPTEGEDGPDAIRTATAALHNVIEPAVLKNPDQWRGWRYLEFQ